MQGASALSSGRRRRRGARKRAALSEINVTPLVDVMLVLLIIFMISAPLLTAGVPVDLPKTEASAVNDQQQPLTITVQQDGRVFLQNVETPFQDLSVRLRAMAGDGFDKPIYVRADGKAPYEKVAQVMAALSVSGFSKINLITDTGGPRSGPDAAPPPVQNALR
ncbi:MAG TPA: protein TolR [Caulobacteraceae bacterium]|nr:protein TolR [Caulobacteraceae bacterium]